MNEKKKSFYNEKKNEKFYGTEPKGYCPFEQAAGALVCWGAGVWALGAGRAGVRQALGVRERAGAGRSGRRSSRQAGRAAAARRARGRLGERQQGARGAQATGGRRAGRHGLGAQGRAAGRTVRAGHGRPGRGPGAGWVADWASWASFGALCTWLSSGSVFGPGSTRYFPESPNEHCSL